MEELFLAEATIESSMQMLYQIAKENGSAWHWDTGKGTEVRYKKEESPQVVACLQAIIKSKNKLRRGVKKEKQLLKQAMDELRKYFVTVPIDEQIKITKLIN